jgi:hypothetical protein
MDFRKLYEDNSGQLTEAKELKKNHLYITEDGNRIKYLGGEEGSLSFIIETSSPLVEGYLVSELSNNKGGLPMFWKLLNKTKDENTD